MLEGISMKELIKLSNKIKDENLRKMVVDFLKELKLSNEHFKKYPKMKIEDAASMFTVGGPSGTSSVERDVLNHTKSLVGLCEKTADVLEGTYDMKLDRDSLTAAAILHDIMKLFEWKRTEAGLEHTGVLLDHTMLGVAELYHRGFPEEVIHIVAAHYGDSGPTPPRNFEALIFHHLDTMVSMVEFRAASVAQQQQQVQLLLLNDEIIKKLKNESGGEPPESEPKKKSE